MAENHKTNTILVVDDEPLNIQLLSTYLFSEGYIIITANSGAEAVEQVKEKRPDLVLLDVMMPNMNGYEVCEIIKSNEETKFIPVILVTALQELEHKIKGQRSGADDFISKPYNKVELLVRVKSLLRIKNLHDTLQEKVIELQRTKDKLRQQAITDGLTGLYNYRHFKEQLLQELNRARRHKSHVSLIMLDIDKFKDYNDTNGHLAGDMVLKNMASLLKDNIRNIDLAARYGGEEFALILIETNKPSAKIVAEKIRKLIEDFSFEYEETQPEGKITISTGVSTFPEDAQDFDSLVNIADKRLYRAKQAGRNVVFIE